MDSEKVQALKLTLAIALERLALDAAKIPSHSVRPLNLRQREHSERSERFKDSGPMLEKIRVRNQLLIDEITKALQRMERGCYGMCRKCAVEIDDSELTREPLIQLCSGCRKR